MQKHYPLPERAASSFTRPCSIILYQAINDIHGIILYQAINDMASPRSSFTRPWMMQLQPLHHVPVHEQCTVLYQAMNDAPVHLYQAMNDAPLHLYQVMNNAAAPFTMNNAAAIIYQAMNNAAAPFTKSWTMQQHHLLIHEQCSSTLYTKPWSMQQQQHHPHPLPGHQWYLYIYQAMNNALPFTRTWTMQQLFPLPYAAALPFTRSKEQCKNNYQAKKQWSLPGYHSLPGQEHPLLQSVCSWYH